MKICILTIATNKYIQFVERLYNNIEENFLNGHDIQGLLFTEHDVETRSIKVRHAGTQPSDNKKSCNKDSPQAIVDAMQQTIL